MMASSDAGTTAGEGLGAVSSQEYSQPPGPGGLGTGKNEQESPMELQSGRQDAQTNGDETGDNQGAGSEDLDSEDEGEGVGQMLRSTVDDLESALQETRQLLAARDRELSQVKIELDRYRQQAAREIANKTRLAQALDQSQSHTSHLEGLLQGWQAKLQEYKVENEKLYAALVAEQSKTRELQSDVVFSQEKDRQIEALKSDLQDCRAMLSRHVMATPTPPLSPVTPTSPIDGMQHQFLKQAIFHLLTESHAEEHLRAICSILDFDAQQRMAIRKKREEKNYKNN